MLEKNKDYLEMRVSSTDCAFAQNEWAQVRVDGYVYSTYMNIPDPGKLYVFISKEKFDKLQTENEQLKKKLTECEKDYISERDKAEAFEKEIKYYKDRLRNAVQAAGCAAKHLENITF